MILTNEMVFGELADRGYVNSFQLPTSKKLLEMTVFEKKIEIDICYRDPKKCFTTLRFPLHGWRKIETVRDRIYKKKKQKKQQNNLSLQRRKHDVAHEKESDNELDK